MAKAETKKTEKKQENVVGKIQKSAESITEKVKEYNDKYLARRIEKGRETFKEYNDKYVVKTFEKGRETVKEYNDKYVAKALERGKGYIDRPYKKVSGTMDEWLEKSRELEKDAWKKLDVYVENSRKFMYKLPMVENIEKRLTSGLNAVPEVVNLPGKADIEKLTKAMEKLNKNIETMQKQKA